MKFSIFFEMQIADPTAAKEAQTFHDCVEQAVYDELAITAVSTSHGPTVLIPPLGGVPIVRRCPHAA